MVEVFKTNITRPEDAYRILRIIHSSLPSHKASFDLDDCDKILRVVNQDNEICSSLIIKMIQEIGFKAAILT